MKKIQLKLKNFIFQSTPSTEVNIAEVKEMVTENCHLSSREIAAELSVSHESIRTILNDCLGMKRVSAWTIPIESSTSCEACFHTSPSNREFVMTLFISENGLRHQKKGWS